MFSSCLPAGSSPNHPTIKWILEGCFTASQTAGASGWHSLPYRTEVTNATVLPC
jgi:hypothetical protein